MLQENSVETSSSWLSTSDHQRNWKVRFSGSGSKRDGCLNIFCFQAREVDENLFGGIAVGQARERGTQDDAGPLKTGSPTGTDK